MTVSSSYKRRIIARKTTQAVTLETLGSLKYEADVKAYHALFTSVELLANAALEHTFHDELITIINTARLAQYCRNLDDLNRYLDETNQAGVAWNRKLAKEAAVAEQATSYTPEATMTRLQAARNPPKLRVGPSGASVVTLYLTARLDKPLPPSSARLLCAEQVYGPFWTIKARCFAFKRGNSASVATAFLEYKAKNDAFAKAGFRLLQEYKISQSVYKDYDVYMLLNLSRLTALRDTTILEISLANETSNSTRNVDLPIIERAEAVAASLPPVVSADSRRYIVHRLAEAMSLEEKRDSLRSQRYKAFGPPRQVNMAAVVARQAMGLLCDDLAATIGVEPKRVSEALAGNYFTSLAGTCIRAHGRAAWDAAVEKAIEWKRLHRIATR